MNNFSDSFWTSAWSLKLTVACYRKMLPQFIRPNPARLVALSPWKVHFRRFFIFFNAILADENEGSSLASVPPVVFSPSTQILNASLSLNLARQMKNSQKSNNNDSIMNSNSSNSSTPPPLPDDGLPSYVKKPQEPIQTGLAPNGLATSTPNPLYHNLMSKLWQSGYPPQPLLYQQLQNRQFMSFTENDNEDEEVDVDA